MTTAPTYRGGKIVAINLVVDLLYDTVDPRLRVDRAVTGGH
jgi:hypothetical protein